MASKCLIKNEIRRKKIIVYYNNFLYYIHFLKNKSVNDVFDYKLILNNKYHKCSECYNGNFFYGNSCNLKNYASYRKSIKACIEHGVYFGNYVNEKESSDSGLPAIITYSNNRKSHLRKVTNKPIFVIGPYIYYANSLYTNEEINKIKSKFGKTLLVFPSHSIDRVKAEFDIESFVKKIINFKDDKEFKTVLICLYWKDIELGRDKIYKDYGFTVVTAGYREDPDFLSRLKTFINISDYTISNNVGTHIGYCIALDKPHTIIEQKTEYCGVTSRDFEAAINSSVIKSSLVEKNEVKNAFNIYNDFITDEQRVICNKYWGLDKVKNNQQLNFILNFCDDIYINSNKNEKEFYSSILKFKNDHKKIKNIEILNEAIL